MRNKLSASCFGGMFAGIALLSASCSEPSGSVTPEGVVGRAGDRFVTQDDLRAEILQRQDDGQRVDSVEQVLNDLLQREALLIRAEQVGLQNDPAVQRDIEQLLIDRLRERELSGKLQDFDVTEDAVREEYASQIDAYTRPGLDRFSVLFLEVSRNASDEKKKAIYDRMAVAEAQARDGDCKDGFGALALDYSDDQLSRYKGGDIGWVAHNKLTTRIPEAVLQKGRALAPGEMSEMIADTDGLYLVMKTNFRPASTTAYEHVSGVLRRKLLSDGRQAVEDDYVTRCLTAAGVDVDRKGLEELTSLLKEEPERAASAQRLMAAPPGTQQP